MYFRGNKTIQSKKKISKNYLNLRTYLKVFMSKFLPKSIFDGLSKIYLGKKFFSRKKKFLMNRTLKKKYQTTSV